MFGFFQTRDTWEAAALASFSEIEFIPELPLQLVHNHESKEQYYMMRFQATDLVNKLHAFWGSDKTIEDKGGLITPDLYPAVIAYQLAMRRNYERLRTAQQQAKPWQIVKRGMRTYFIPPKEEEKK